MNCKYTISQVDDRIVSQLQKAQAIIYIQRLFSSFLFPSYANVHFLFAFITAQSTTLYMFKERAKTPETAFKTSVLDIRRDLTFQTSTSPAQALRNTTALQTQTTARGGAPLSPSNPFILTV